ncbi:MAG TPA: hypothetical protein VKZ18_19300 [Polyangia bacterium]|nr:hypothetical protein [Polyangia bacterium]
MFSKWGLGVLLAVGLFPVAGVAAPGEPARPRVVVVNAVDLPDSLADIRAQLRTTLNDAVTKHGYDLAPEAGSCADRECLRVAAVSAGASDVLVATGGRNDMRGYRVQLRIWNVASDREDNAIAECNICAATQMVENVAAAADPLLDRVPTLHANLSATAAPLPAPTPATAAPAPALVATPAPPAEAKSNRRWLGWTLIGAGVAGGAASVALFAINGHDTDCTSLPATPTYNPCAATRTTALAGGIVAGLSAVAIAGGIVYLIRGNQDHPGVALGIQPFGLTLGGRL